MSQPPNIVLLVGEHADGLTLGSAGSPVRTPNLDAVAADGVSFTQMRTPTALCSPARAALMSGLYPHANGMWNNNHTRAAIRRDLFPGVRLWSEDLCAAGYKMNFLGKWHVSATRSPSDVGWEERGRDIPGDIQRRVPTERGHNHLVDAQFHEVPGWPRRTLYGTTTIPIEQMGDSRLTTRAVELIDAHAGQRAPWCLYVGYISPHAPYVAHERYLKHYDVDAIPKPPGYGDDLRDKPNLYRRLHEQNWGHLDWPDIAQMIRHRYAMISYLDDQVGRILDALDRTGQAENTLFLYTSDHGDYAGSHGLFSLGVPAFDPVYRVPGLARWPAGTHQPGRRNDDFVSLLDVGPTILDAAGLPPLDQAHGRSLMPFLRAHNPPDWRQEFYGEFLGHESLYTQRQVRTRDFKYVWNSFDYDELYDLTIDPDETVNRRDQPEYRDIQRDLIGQLWRWSTDTDDVFHTKYHMNGNLPIGPGILQGSA